MKVYKHFTYLCKRQSYVLSKSLVANLLMAFHRDKASKWITIHSQTLRFFINIILIT